MGLSKKLGSYQKLGLPASNTVPYKWSNQTYTVEDILSKFKLPCVVQCATDSCTVVWSDFQFDLRQPLLFYSKRSIQKVHAISLKKTNEDVQEIGPPLAIPEDYEGWFGAAPKCKSMEKRHFIVESMANSTAHQFLITTKCPAFTANRTPDGNHQYVPHDVTPGEVLKRVCVMDTDTSHPDCPDLVKQHGPCLEFLDEKGEDVIIPMSHSVLSYEIGNTYPDEETRVFKITSPVKAGNSKLPRILKLIHGDPPLLAYAFTGTIRCYSVFTEETILAATLEDPGSRCLELATDSCVKFRLCLNEVIVKKTCEYTNAFQMCENFGVKFMMGIKVSFTLKPEMSNLGDADLSFNESASDVQEVEANSEFDIAWGSVKKARLFIGSGTIGEDNNVDALTPSSELLKEEMMQYETKQVSHEISEDSDVSNSIVPQNEDFTEQDIVNLMLRKGMVDQAGKANEVPQDTDLLTQNRVTDNPLFYFFQRHPDQNPWRKSEKLENNETSFSDEPSQENVSIQNPNDQENPLHNIFQKEPLPGQIKNPLAYLFEQTPDKPLNKSENISFLDINQSSPSQDLQSDFLDSVSDDEVDISHFHQVVCKTAREYTGNNDVDDEDKEDDDSTDDDDEDDDSGESDGNYSEMSELPDDINELSFSQENTFDTSKKNDTHSTRTVASQKPSLKVEGQKAGGSIFAVISGHSFADNERTLITGLSSNIKNIERADNLDVSVDETDVFVDLLTLAEIESNKYNTNADNIESSPNIDGSKDKPVKDHSNSIHRLNNLLEEVSQLVNISSGRIMDGNKMLVSQQQEKVISQQQEKIITQQQEKVIFQQQEKAISAPAIKRDLPVPTPRLSKTKTNDYSSASSSSTSISRKSSETTLEGAESGKNRHELVSDGTTLRKRGPKSKLNNVDDFCQKLNHFKNEDSTVGAVRRPRRAQNLDHIGQEQINKVYRTPKKSHRISPSESSISSIFSVAHNHVNKMDSSQTNYYRGNYPLRHSSEINDIRNDYTSSCVMDGSQTYSFPYKSQRVLSLTNGRDVLASFQNLERSSSIYSSTSSNCSSSLDSNIVHSGPKLLVIGDPDLVIEGSHRITQLTSQDFTASSSTKLPKFAPNRSYAHESEGNGEVVTVKEHYDVSRSGHLKPDRLMLALEEYLHVQDGDYSLREDYV